MRKSKTTPMAMTLQSTKLSSAVLIALMAAGQLATSVGTAAEANEETYAFDLPPQKLEDALQALAFVSQHKLLYSSRLVEGRDSPAVKGKFTAEEAVKKLLTGTDLQYHVTSDGLVVIRSSDAGAPRPVSSRGQAGDEKRLRLAQSQSAPAESSFTARSAAGESASSSSNALALEEIIVTARKKEERLQDVPMSVAVVDARGLLARNELRVQDYIHKLPGVSLALVGNAGEPQIVLRGMTTGPGGNPTAGVVIDEVPYTRSRGLFLNSVPDIDPGDLRHVEVLRGPQGTLYGASNMGGLLKYVTLDPSTDAFSGQVSVGATHVHYGDDLGYSVRGSANIPLADNFALRVSGFTLKDAGYIDNPQAGQKDINDRDGKGGRVAMLWQPSESTSVKFGAIVQQSNRNGMAEIDQALGRDPKRNFRAGTGNYDRETQLFSLTVKSTLGPVELVSATGYGTEESTSLLDVTSLFGGPEFVGAVFPGTSDIVTTATIEDRKFTQEFRAELPLGERLTWLAGVFYTKESNVYDLTIDAVTPAGQKGGLFLRNTDHPGTDFEERAVFTNLTVDITDRLDVQFGGRYSENDQVEMRSGVSFGINPVGTPYDVNQRLVADGNAFTYLVTPRFKITPDLMTYARYATGYRPGGSNINCGIPQVPCEFDEDTSINYELGIKGSPFDRAFTFDLAIYYIDWDDIQIGGLVPPGAGSPDIPVTTTYTGNVGRATSKGVELALSTQLLSSLSVSLAGAYNDTELRDTLPTGIGAGSQLPFGAPWSGSLTAQQEFALDAWNGARFLVEASASYMGERSSLFLGPGMDAELPAYTKFDMNFSLEASDWLLNLFVNNVADKRAALARSGILPGSLTYVEPRTIGISLTKQF